MTNIPSDPSPASGDYDPAEDRVENARVSIGPEEAARANNNPHNYWIRLQRHTDGWGDQDFEEALAALEAEYETLPADSESRKAYEAAIAFLKWQGPANGPEAAFWQAFDMGYPDPEPETRYRDGDLPHDRDRERYTYYPPHSVPLGSWHQEVLKTHPDQFYADLALGTAFWTEDNFLEALSVAQAQLKEYETGTKSFSQDQQDKIALFKATIEFIEGRLGYSTVLPMGSWHERAAFHEPAAFVKDLVERTARMSDEELDAAIADVRAQYARVKEQRGLGEGDEIRAFEAALDWLAFRKGDAPESIFWTTLAHNPGPAGDSPHIPMGRWQQASAESEPYAFYVYLQLHTAGWSEEDYRNAIADMQSQYDTVRGTGKDAEKAFEAALAFLRWRGGLDNEYKFWDALDKPPMYSRDADWVGDGDTDIGPPPGAEEWFLPRAYGVLMSSLTHAQYILNSFVYQIEGRNALIAQLRDKIESLDPEEDQKEITEVQNEIDRLSDLSSTDTFKIKQYQNQYQNYLMLLDALLQMVKDLTAKLIGGIRT